jgi:hypothetical protein
MARVILITTRKFNQFDSIDKIEIDAVNLRQQFYKAIIDNDSIDSILRKIHNSSYGKDLESFLKDRYSFKGAGDNLVQFNEHNISKRIKEKNIECNDNEELKKLLIKIYELSENLRGNDTDGNKKNSKKHLGNIYKIHSNDNNNDFLFVAHELPITIETDDNKDEDIRKIKTKLSYIKAIVEDIKEAIDFKNLIKQGIDLEWIFINHDVDWLLKQTNLIAVFNRLEGADEKRKREIELIFELLSDKDKQIFKKENIFIFQHTNNSIYEKIIKNYNAKETPKFLFNTPTNELYDTLSKSVIIKQENGEDKKHYIGDSCEYYKKIVFDNKV